MAYTTIDDPSVYFQTALWTGNGSTPTITNDGNSDMQPDWLWGKNRTGTADHHYLIDSSRGTNKYVLSNSTSAEITNAAISSFNSDGFTLTSDVGLNRNSSTFVGWQWKANGGTTTTNDASSTGVGNVDSVYQVNSTAKFGIMTYTATGSGNITVAHGMGSAPKFLITKVRDQGFGWFVWHHTLANTHGLGLNSTNASADSSDALGDTSPSSTVFTMGNGGNANNNYQSGDDIICYYFDEVQGYSKFGKYTGNNNADGPFVYTGFKPAWLLIKNTSSAGNSWVLLDNKRQGFNVENDFLFPNATDAESVNLSNHGFDFLSNGFKNRGTGQNDDGDTFIYMAFAESPFVSSEGVPTTAR